MLVQHMSNGFSFKSFAGIVRVGISTIYQWSYDHDEFRDAAEEGRSLCVLFYERLMLSHSFGKVKGDFRAASYMSKWAAKIDVDVIQTDSKEHDGYIFIEDKSNEKT